MTLLLVSPLEGLAAQQDCLPGLTSLLDHTLVLEDPDKSLGAAEVIGLPTTHFHDTRSSSPSWAFTRSAIWLRFELVNTQEAPCPRWLTVGEPRLEDVQVFVLHQGVWSHMQAGSAFPLESWSTAARQPRFKLDVPPGDSVAVLVRVTSRSSMLIEPRLWDHSTLMAAVSAAHLMDGIAIGFILLIVLVGLAIGGVIRSRLLTVTALVLLCYSSFTLVVNGYLFYWPTLLPWARELVSILSAAAFLLCYFFIYELFRLPLLGRWFNTGALIYVLTTVLVLLLGATGDFVLAQERFELLRYGVYILVPLALISAVYQRVRLTWLAWLLCVLLSMQGLYWLWQQITDHAWRDRADLFSLQSAFIFVLLLICTLTFESLQMRRRERFAEEEIEHLKQAEHERLESQVEQRTAQLRESLKARSSLLGRISHDLRSPLNSIIYYAQGALVSSTREYLERIERHARQQLALLDDLVEFSKTELQQLELSLAPGYLFGFLHEIEEEGRFLAQRRNNGLRCDLASDLPAVVNADFQQLRRVLINLLNNAAKFTKDGLIVLQVETLSQHQLDRGLRFTVRDNGPGFPSEGSHQLVEAFQRGTNAAGVDGFGLGLSIVAELLKQMGSELRIESSAEKGSALSFELDLHFASEEELDNVFLESHTIGLNGEGCRIVLVDDIALTRVFLGDLLLGYGFDVTTVATAEEALSCLAAGPADLLITDQMMPGTNGWTLLYEARQKHPGLPVLLYSSMPPRPPLEHQNLIFDATLLKPASTNKLLASIQNLCRLRPRRA